MTDENLLLTVIFQTIARLRSGSTVTESEVHGAAWNSANEYSPVGTNGDANYALALNAVQAIKDDWQQYITVSE